MLTFKTREVATSAAGATLVAALSLFLLHAPLVSLGVATVVFATFYAGLARIAVLFLIASTTFFAGLNTAGYPLWQRFLVMLVGAVLLVATDEYYAGRKRSRQRLATRAVNSAAPSDLDVHKEHSARQAVSSASPIDA